jgi:hypothetical protein
MLAGSLKFLRQDEKTMALSFVTEVSKMLTSPRSRLLSNIE